METVNYPRVTIQFCTQCKWLLRAAYVCLLLLMACSAAILTNATSEVSLLPATGGVFVVEIHHQSSTSSGEESAIVNKTVLWDRKTDGGFPETKELKKRVRDVIDPGRDLGHVDGKKKPSVELLPSVVQGGQTPQVNPTCMLKEGGNVACEDCN